MANENVFYNPYNTTLYALIFALAAIYLGRPALRKLDIDLNADFFKSIAPYIFLGGALRSLKDIGIAETILLETPFIYFLMFFYTLAALLASRKLEELYDIEYYKTFLGAGLFPLITLLGIYAFNLNQDGPTALLYTGVIFSLIVGSGYLALKKFKPALATYSFTIPVAAHYWDATTSFVAISSGGLEKHVLANFFIDLMGPAGMFAMKSLVIIPVVYYINENIEGEEKLYYLFLVALLGIALGTRNLISLVTV